MMPAALEADLRLLSALAVQDEEIEDLLRETVRDLKAAIPSAMGLSLTVHLRGQDVTLTTLEDDVGTAGASILVPLGPASVSARSSIVFYAATPGAFVDLAADVGWATGLSEQAIQLDQHVPPAIDGSAMTGLLELSTANQAIGILIERGNTAESARAELERRAACRSTTVQQVAAEIVRGGRSGGSVA